MSRKSIFTLVTLIWLSLILGLLVPAKAQSNYDPTVQTQALLYHEARTVYLGNLARRDNGVPPLRWNLQLTHAARWFSWDSTENRPNGFCGHQDTLGRWPGERALFFGYLGSAGAENAFCGYLPPEDAIQGWMNSSGHRANLLDPNSREVGLGYYRRDSDGRGYVTQGFGNDAVYAPVIIENEAIFTTNSAVNLYIYDRSTGGGFTGFGTATEMMVSNSPHFIDATWESYNAEKIWTLTYGVGWRDVYVKTRDIFNRTLTVKDTIYLGEETDVPLNELGARQMSTTQSQVTLYNLDGGALPQAQFSLGWLADDTFGTFTKWWGNGERVEDMTAWGDTAYRLYPGDGESFAWVYDTAFIKNTPLVAYFRLKVNNNTSISEVARISIQGGSTEYGPLILKGTNFNGSNQYQEFALNFTFNPTSQDPFLIFKFWRSGGADVYVDAVSIFSTPQPITSPLIWSVPGGNYRGQGVWVRYTDGSEFSDVVEATTTPYTISGNTGVGEVTLHIHNGTEESIVADGSGNYSITVPYGWSGTITPSHPCFGFTPDSRVYNNITEDLSDQNYTAGPSGACVSSTFLSSGLYDGWILESSETSGVGGTLNKNATLLRVGDDAANKQYRSILSFDTSTLPEGAIITSVTLKFKYAGKTGRLPFGATHGNLFADMCEGAFKNNSSLQLADFNVRCPAGLYKVKALIYTNSSNVGGWYTQTLLPADFGLINLGSVTQFRLRFARDDNNDRGADFLKIYSGNALLEADRPQLVIEYYVP